MNDRDDYLWNPSATPDRAVSELERALAPISARERKLAERALLVHRRSEVRRSSARRLWLSAAAAACVVIVTCAALMYHRLSWPEGAAWSIAVNGSASSTNNRLHVGATVETGARESATLQVARIGEVVLAEHSVATLTETRSGRHRMELAHGRLRAKIWAPPGHFGVANRDALAIDLGCEFELQADVLGQGSLSVISGWVIYNRHGTETLVPADHAITFDQRRVSIPLRADANESLRYWLAQIDSLAASGDSDQLERHAAEIAAAARDDDYLTLLILVTRHPRLQSTPIASRLKGVLGETGSGDPIDAWWQRVPRPPKQWWWHWRDAF